MRFFKNSFRKATPSVNYLAVMSFVSIIFLLGFVNAFGQAPGSLDITFNTTGKQTTTFASGGSGAAAVAIQPADGKIVAVGTAPSGGNNAFALARYNTDGTLDTAGFGTNGAGGGTVLTPISTGAVAFGVAIQSDGKIIAVGFAEPGDFVVVRYNTNGSLDTTFNSTGIATLDFFGDIDQANAVVIQSTGKIVAVGSAVNPGTGFSNFAIARFNTNGTLDTTFGDPLTPGKRTSTVLGDAEAFAAAMQTDDSIVAAGRTSDLTNGNVFAIARFTAGGALDATFGSSGIVTTNFNSADDQARGVAIDGANNIIAAGQSFVSGSNYDVAVARYTSTGTLDATFGIGGKTTTAISTGADFGNAVTVQSDGKVIVAGTTGPVATSDFAVVRYTTTGLLDSTFGTGGVKTVDFAAGQDSVGAGKSVALQADGKIVVVGQSSGNAFGVIRLIGGSLTTAAGVTVSGHVTTQSGAGIQNVVVTLTDATTGDTKQVKTKQKGFYFFKNVRVGAYTISVSAKKYSFSQPTTFINVKGDTQVDFVATK